MSSIQVAKSSMGFQSAGQRDGCARCYHVTKVSPDLAYAGPNNPQWKCRKGGFLTSAMAICQQFQPIFINRGVTR
ncbi:MAG: hypothetical protein ACOY95_06835 [Pseudomonadota bacterium]